jgi:hypothetical protein
MELLTALLRMLVMLADAAKILAVRQDQANLPCWPACLVLIKYFMSTLVEVNIFQTNIYLYILEYTVTLTSH